MLRLQVWGPRMPLTVKSRTPSPKVLEGFQQKGWDDDDDRNGANGTENKNERGD